MRPISDFRVRIFGEPLLETQEGECRLSPFQRALLMIIFAERSISRPRVAGLLWEQDANPRTRHRIRQLKSEIGRRAGAPLVEASGDLLRAPHGVHSDALELDAHLEAGRLAKAAELIANGFARHDADAIADAFVDWMGATCTQLRSRILRRASAKWECSIRSDDWHGASDAAEAMYVLTPEDTGATARVIESRARIGRLRSAEVAYAEFCDRHSVGCHTNEVEETITRVRSLTADSSHSASAKADVPFVGRGGALAELSSLFDEVQMGTFSFALISGEAGIGKTRLLHELERFARLEGLRCLKAQPVELERRISLNPIIDALSTLDLEPHLTAIGEPWRTVVGTMLPPGPHAESVRDLPQIEERSLSRRLLDAVSVLFRSIANEQPTVFFLDDLQWADATTISALQFYQRRWNESYFGVVATIRPGAVSKKDPAASYLMDDGRLEVRRVCLDELGDDEARRLVGLLGNQRIDDAEVSKLCALSGRHPLYLTELTRDYLSGRLVLPKSEADAFTIPVSLRQILASRMEGISDPAHSVLNMLSVCSKQMRLCDLAGLLDISLDRVAHAADELRLRQLIELDRDRLWIGHDLFRTAIYRSLSEAHRAVLHHRMAQHIRKRSGEESANELAIHFDRAGRAQLSAKFGWTAAGRALERGAVAEASHFYELVTRNESNEPRRAEATARLATSLHLNRNMSRANPALELASTRLRAVGMNEHARRMDIRRVEGLSEAGDTPVDELSARLSVIKNEAREADDWEAVALALDVELRLLQLAERLDSLRGLYAEFAEILSKDVEIAAAIAHQGLAVGLMLDDPEEALRSARMAVSLTTGLTPDRRLKALNRLFIVLLQQGRLHLAENSGLVSEAEDLAHRSGDLLQRFSFESNVGVSHMDAGDLDRAEVHFNRASDLLGTADMTFSRINLAINRGELGLARNDFGTAVQAFESASQHGGLTIPKYTEQVTNAGLGLCALAVGQVAKARRSYELLQEPPSTWYYDPTIILFFRAKFLGRMKNLRGAIAVLEEAQPDLEGRLVAAWLKNQFALARLLKKARDKRWMIAAREGVAVACRLQLSIRESAFRHLLGADGTQ